MSPLLFHRFPMEPLLADAGMNPASADDVSASDNVPHNSSAIE
jgi:hypothetical protein